MSSFILAECSVENMKFICSLEFLLLLFQDKSKSNYKKIQFAKQIEKTGINDFKKNNKDKKIKQKRTNFVQNLTG